MATRSKILDPKLAIRFDLKDDYEGAEIPTERFKQSEGKIYIYSKTVNLQEIFNIALLDLRIVRKWIIGRNICQLSWGTF